PGGSRLDVAPAGDRIDAAVTALDAPRAAVSGDTVEIGVIVRAGSASTPAGSLALTLGARAVATVAVDGLAAGAERRIALRVPLTGPEGPASLTAALSVARDVERRNDTLAVAVDVVRAAGAVLVSTSPDLDARFLVPVLRGAVSLPTRAYYRVAPDNWRADGSLARVRESEVRRSLREAPLAILHGDTAIFGAPRRATSGALALFAPPPTGGGEWYPVAAPPSPISAALSGLPWDSLPPLELAQTLPRGDWEGLVASRARETERRPVLSGTVRPRRTVTIGAAGLWRWQFRGGASADAFTTLWGSIFDWLSAERIDRRGAIPAEAQFRAGERIRWRRGTAGAGVAVRVGVRAAGGTIARDSVVVAAIRRRDASARVDTILLHFGADGSVADTDPLPAGVYDVLVPGGAALLVVNASRELLPREPTVKSGATGGRAAAGDPSRLRQRAWPFVLVLVALCGEWLARRRIGLR
ncbi:MAG: hypothetical protein M3373_08040, partial [Gemmatimonadota bacterium]|nr:hypothetical protein [Gemmatimonadota bacterium]